MPLIFSELGLLLSKQNKRNKKQKEKGIKE